MFCFISTHHYWRSLLAWNNDELFLHLNMFVNEEYREVNTEYKKIDPLLTLLRSFAVTLSSSRHGIRWTYTNIWYLALMNSVLLGLETTQRSHLKAGPLKIWSTVAILKSPHIIMDICLFKTNNYQSISQLRKSWCLQLKSDTRSPNASNSI